MKIIKTFTCFALVLFILSCMSVNAAFEGMGQDDTNYKIEVSVEPKSIIPSFWVYIKYESNEYLKTKEVESAKVELREPVFSRLPAGGYIIIKLNGNSINMAKGENCVYIVVDGAGKEISRMNGDTGIPNYHVWSNTTTWSAVDIISLSAEVIFPLKIRVVNKIIPNEFYEYLIKKRTS